MVIAPQRVAGNVRRVGIGQAFGHLGIRWQVVHPHRQHALGAGHQFVRVRPFAAVASHPFHFTVVAGIQPVLQVLFVLSQIDGANTQLLKAQLACQFTNLCG